MAKQANIGGGLDKINDLPDAILCHIISFLPIKEAVCTCILSTRWRYLFASMTRLHFDDIQFWHRHHQTNNFMNFMDRLLFFSSKASLECFQLDFSEDSGIDGLRIYGWICAALWRGVKELELFFDFVHHPILLPTILFTCKSLVTLSLTISIMNVPSGACFPNLKNLRLTGIEFSDNGTVQRLFSSCLVLEDLVIDECCFEKISELNIRNPSLKRLEFNVPEQHKDSDWAYDYSITIDAPNLVYFKYDDLLLKGYSGNMHSLVEADISIIIRDEEGEHDEHKRAATEFFQLIQNVQSLRVTIDHHGTIFVLDCEPVVALDKLVELKIREKFQDEDDFDWQEMWLLQLLQCSRNLQSLDFSLEGYPGKGVWHAPEKVPCCLLFQLKEIKLYSESDVGRWLFKLIKYLLKNARVLRKLIIDTTRQPNGDKQLRFAKRLLALPRNSACQVVI